MFTVLEGEKERLVEAIQSVDAETVRSENLDDLAAQFVDKFRVVSPELTEAAIGVTVEETQVDVSNDWNRAILDRDSPFLVPGTATTYYVPFVGDPIVFQCKPSSFSTVLPFAEVGDSELVFSFSRPGSDVGSTKQDFDRQLSEVREYLGWGKADIDRFNIELRRLAHDELTRRATRLEQMQGGLAELGLPVRRSLRSIRDETQGPVALPEAQPTDVPERYDVALSFAGENRTYVEKVAERLRAAEISVFYDKFEQATLWGKNLIDHLAEIYQKRSRYVVMFISEHYVAKPWPSHERTHAQSRALLARDEYILPARFDDTEVPGLAGTVSHIDLRETNPEQLAQLIVTKLGRT